MTGIINIKDWIISFLIHIILFLTILFISPEGKKKFTPLEIEIVKTEKELAKTEEFLDLTTKEARISPSHIHRSKKGIVKKEFKPVVGVTEESVTEGGDVSVPLGNTLMGVPENKVNENIEYAPLFSVTRMPSFRVQIKPEYPESARRLGIEGLVLLEVAISSEGKVVEVKILEEPGFGLGEAARSAILRSEFEPAISEGTPVAVRVRIPVRFRLVD